MAQTKKDNSTYWQKVKLRRSALSKIETPIVMETNGGLGKLYEAVYSKVQQGIVFEKQSAKVDVLAKQRPRWSVYEGDCIAALSAGIGAHLEINLLDIDPYGSPWPIVDGFFASVRPRARTLHIVVNDGMRMDLQVSRGFGRPQVKSLVDRFGAGGHLFTNYLDCCQILLSEKVSQAGYDLTHWHGYYCGPTKCMTHYWAVLELANLRS